MKKFMLFAVLSLGSILAVSAQNVVLSQIVGKVEVKKAGSQSWIKATEGMVISLKSSVSTGYNSTVTAKVASSTLRIKPLTRMTVEEYGVKSGKETAIVNLGAGKVQANVKSLDGKEMTFKVTSPVATASVRGTDFDFNGYQLNVNEGNVFYQNEYNVGTGVGGGQDSSVNESGEPTDPEAYFEDEAYVDPSTDTDFDSDDDDLGDFEDYSDIGLGDINGSGTLQLYIK